MLSYFQYYIIKTQQARKNIVLKLCGYAAAFRSDVCGVWSHKWEGVGVLGCRNITVIPIGLPDFWPKTTKDFLAVDVTSGNKLCARPPQYASAPC